MAIANVTLEWIKKGLKYGCDYTLQIDGKKYNIGLRCSGIPHYYFLNWQTLELKIYYTTEDLLRHSKLDDEMSIEYRWNEIEILKESKSFNIEDEVEIIKKYIDGQGEE